MKLRHAILTLAATTMLAMPAAAADEPRGADRREAQKSNQRSSQRDSARPQRAERRERDARPNRSDARSDRAQRRDQGDRFRDARRTIRHRTVERASERNVRGHDTRRPSAHDLLRERRQQHHAVRRPATRDHRDRRRHDDRSRVVVDFRIGSPAYCPPPRTTHRVTRTVVIEGPVVERRRPVVAHRPVYVEYRGDAWDDLERGHHRAALDSFGILASAHRYDPLPKIGYGLAAAGLYDDTVAATAFRRALRAEVGALERFRPTPRLTNVLRDLERRYERAARLNPYDSDSVFLLAATRTMQGETITRHDLDNELQMLSREDRELLGLTLVVEEGNVGMYDD